MTVADYVARCLHDPHGGYYATRPALGEDGDFITAPLVSQMFGELIGLWAVETWRRLGSPRTVRLVEVGPGDGALMVDALRAARLAPDFLSACDLVLIEPSPPLRRVQAERLCGGALDPRWIDRLADVEADAPVILIANEVIDCLPARQFVRTEQGWAERCVTVAGDGDDLAFALAPVEDAPTASPAPVGTLVEISEGQRAFGRDLGRLIRQASGAALLIDYGRDRPGAGDTLQALQRHRKVDPLAEPGAADLTQWADFPAVLDAASQAGAAVVPCLTQGDFLRRLGVETRAQRLAASRPDRAPVIERQLRRLIDSDQMGVLFKACAVHHPPSLVPPGFEP